MTALAKIQHAILPQAKTTGGATSYGAPSILQKSLAFFGGGATDAQTLEQFAQVSTLWKGLSVRAESFAAIPWTLYRTNGRLGKRTPVDKHPALVLLENPNSFQDGFDFRVTYCLMMDLLGKAFIYTPLRGSMPTSQYLLRPDKVTIEVDSQGKKIDCYLYKQPNGETIKYSPEEVSFRRLPDPLNPLDGIGAVETLLKELTISRLSQNWQTSFFANNAAPAGIYKFKDALEPEVFNEMTKRIRNRSNADKDIILDNAADYDRVDFSMREMQFPELREASRDTILEGLGLPKTFLGQATEVNRASAESLEFLFARYELVPALTRFKSWLNNDLLAKFDSKQNYEFDFTSPVKDDIDAQTKAVDNVLKLESIGADPTEAMEMFNLPPLKFEKPDPATKSGYTSDQTAASRSKGKKLDAETGEETDTPAI